LTVPDLNALAELAAPQMTPDQIEQFAGFAAKIGDRYSLRNRFLLWLQAPDASHVEGFRAWQAMGRQVRKGGKGIAFLAPLTRKAKTEAGAAVDGQAQTQAPEVGQQRVVYGVRVAYVFDISQTDQTEGADQAAHTAQTGQAPSGADIQAMLDALLAEAEAESDEQAGAA
jgi:hypothetical protein